MIRSAADLQLRSLEDVVNLASPRIKCKPRDVPLLRRLLNICIRAAPSIVPPDPIMTTPVLSHPDLALSNLMVAPTGPAFVTSAINWQGATISPFPMQCGTPPALDYSQSLIKLPPDGSMPAWPHAFDAMSPEEQEIVRVHHRYACRLRLYTKTMARVDPLRALVSQLPHSYILEKLVTAITRCIADGPLELRGFLIDLQEMWSSIAESNCPCDFSPEEIAAHRAEDQAHQEYTQNVEELCARLGCQPDGAISNDRYELAKVEMERHRTMWDEVDMKGPFPFYEGA